MSEPVDNIQTGNIKNTYQTPNWHADRALPLLTDLELRVLMFLDRNILGYRDQRKRFSLTVIMSGTGLSKPSVVKALRGLVQARIVVQPNPTDHSPAGTYYCIEQRAEAVNWDFLKARKNGELPATGKRDLPVNEAYWSTPFTSNEGSTGKHDLPVLVNAVNPCKPNSKPNNGRTDAVVAVNAVESLAATCPPSRPSEPLTEGEAFRKRAKLLQQDQRVADALFHWGIQGGRGYEEWLDYLMECWKRGIELDGADHEKASQQAKVEFAAKQSRDRGLKAHPRWLINCLRDVVTERTTTAQSPATVASTNGGPVVVTLPNGRTVTTDRPDEVWAQWNRLHAPKPEYAPPSAEILRSFGCRGAASAAEVH